MLQRSVTRKHLKLSQEKIARLLQGVRVKMSALPELQHYSVVNTSIIGWLMKIWLDRRLLTLHTGRSNCISQTFT